MNQNTLIAWFFIHILIQISAFRTVSSQPLITKQPDLAQAASFSMYVSGLPAAASSKKEEDDAIHYNLILIPVENDVLNRRGINALEPIHPSAGEPFSVWVAVVNERAEIQPVDGEFQFLWSGQNYIDPSKPNHRARLVGADRWFPVQDGTALIRNIRYDETGVIQLTGMARIRVVNTSAQNKGKGENQGNDREEEERENFMTKVIIRNSGAFAVVPDDFHIAVRDRPETLIAGEEFRVDITPVNAFGEVIANYRQDRQDENRTLQMVTRVVAPAEARDGILVNAQGSPVYSVAFRAFRDGSATLEALRYSEAGEVEMQVVDPNFLGQRVAGKFYRISRFLPGSLQLEAVVQTVSGGVDAEYNYFGQTHPATVTLTAQNRFSPPGRTFNYSGEEYSLSREGLDVYLPVASQSIGEVSYSFTQTGFRAGMNILNITQQVMVRVAQEPSAWGLRYQVQGRDGLTGGTQSSAIAFRSGRLRIRGYQGSASDYLEVRVEVESRLDARWQRNRDEDRIVLRPADFAILGSAFGMHVDGAARNVFAGYAHGGGTPLEVIARNMQGPVRFHLDIDERSSLSFFGVVSEPWLLMPTENIGYRRRIFHQRMNGE